VNSELLLPALVQVLYLTCSKLVQFRTSLVRLTVAKNALPELVQVLYLN